MKTSVMTPNPMPLNWKSADPSDVRRYRIVERLLRRQPKLLAWLFRNDRPEMIACAEDVLKRMGGFSSGEQIMIRIAVEIWFSGGGGASVFDICRRLDGHNFAAAIEAMAEYRNL